MGIRNGGKGPIRLPRILVLIDATPQKVKGRGVVLALLALGSDERHTARPCEQYKRVLEYLSRYGIRYCSGGYPNTGRRFWVPARILANPIVR